MAKDTKKPLDGKTPDPSKPIKGKEGGEDPKGGKTFTQEELDKAIEARLGRKDKTNAIEKAEAISAAVEEALKEERRLSKMNQEEKEKELLEKQTRENAEREQKITLRENTLTAMDKLVELGIPAEKAKGVAKFLVTEDLETQEASISEFVDLFNESVESLVEQKMSGNPPKDVNTNKSKNIAEEIKPASYI